MKRKKVAILLRWMVMGGVNKAALNLMNALLPHCDVTLILREYRGELLAEIPQGVDVTVDDFQPFRAIVKDDLRHLRPVALVRDAMYYGKIWLGHDSVDNYRYLVSRQRMICETEFDCAIAFHGQSLAGVMDVLQRVRAKQKYAWLHGEFREWDTYADALAPYYARFDRLLFVSRPTMDAFLRRFAVEKARCGVCRAPLDEAEILRLAADPCLPAFPSGCIKLLTVGRLSIEKGQDMIPEIARRLADAGQRVHWYLIGDGILRETIEQEIARFGVADCVTLLGTLQNPYPHMGSCDIYVQPSLTEGFCTGISEAGILGRAIVGTAPSGGIREQITDGVDGRIVGADVDSLTDAILELIEKDDLRREFSRRIREKDLAGKDEICKFLAYPDGV